MVQLKHQQQWCVGAYASSPVEQTIFYYEVTPKTESFIDVNLKLTNVPRRVTDYTWAVQHVFDMDTDGVEEEDPSGLDNDPGRYLKVLEPRRKHFDVRFHSPLGRDARM